VTAAATATAAGICANPEAQIHRKSRHRRGSGRPVRAYRPQATRRALTLGWRRAAVSHAVVSHAAVSAEGAGGVDLPLRPKRLRPKRLRPVRLRPVRLRLLLVVLLPMLGLGVLAATQAGTSLATTSDSACGLVIADAASVSADLAHHLERELAETMALRERGGSAGNALVLAQRARTDAALRRYRTRRDVTLRTAPALAAAYEAADAGLARLPGIRAGAPPGTSPLGTSGSSEWEAAYREVTAAVVDLGRALPGQLTDHRLAVQARGLADLTAAAHALAEQRDLVRTVLTRGAYSRAEQAALAGLAAVELQWRDDFRRSADRVALDTYARLVAGSDVDSAVRIRDGVLAGDASALGTDADAWYVASTHAVRRTHEVVLTLAVRLHEVAVAELAAARRAAAATLGGSALVVLATVAVAVVLATRISRRLRRLHMAALGVADIELPTAIEALGTASDPVAVHQAGLATAGALDTAVGAGPLDEITQVGRAFAAVHRQALQLAAAQAIQRLDTAAVFVALARRNQTLVQRQLRAIDDLERDETDPDTLAAFYAVDHLAARMRRNSENLLVLAGSEPGRRFTAAQSLLDVVRAAAAEIDDYTRVDPVDLPPAAVTGHAVGDLVHLLAELLENATRYSAPGTRVRVTARYGSDGLALAIYDDGIGLAAQHLAEANHRLASQADLTASLAGTMGLLVVARLAARHGVRVQLRSQLGVGTVALVGVPAQLLALPERIRPLPQPQPVVAAVSYEQLASHVAHNLAAEPGTATGAGLPRRRAGVRLVPGSIPGDDRPVHIDPDRVRTRLAGLARALAATDVAATDVAATDVAATEGYPP
jgi:signal transduction histidine kinase